MNRSMAGNGGDRTYGISVTMRALVGLFMIFIQLQKHEVAALRLKGLKPDEIFKYKLRLLYPTPNDFLLVMKTHLPHEASLSCGGKKAGASDGYFHEFALHSNEVRRYFFRADPAEYLVVTCYYAYDGNYMADIVIFDMRWPDVEYCRWKNGGCRFLISSDSSLYKITKKGRVLLGDLAVKHCKNIFGIFYYGCKEKQHDRPLAGRICSYYEWSTQSFD